jgi:hypothetical protein
MAMTSSPCYLAIHDPANLAVSSFFLEVDEHVRALYATMHAFYAFAVNMHARFVHHR